MLTFAQCQTHNESNWLIIQHCHSFDRGFKAAAFWLAETWPE